jgi:DNA-binding MarR family transcriptional regulator
MNKKDLVDELQDALNRLRRSKLFDHGDHLRSAEKHMLFKVAKLKNGQPVTPSELASKMNVSMAAITHHINSLEKQNLITRLHNYDDRRMVAIALSQKGSEEVKNLQREFKSKIKILTDYLGEDDVRDLIRVIKKISDLAEKTKGNNA